MSKQEMFTKLDEAKATAKAAESALATAQETIRNVAMADLVKALAVTVVDHPILEGILKPNVMYASNSPTDFHMKRAKRPIQAVYLILSGGDVGWEAGRDKTEPHTTFIAGVQHLVSVLKEMGWNVNEPDFRADGHSVSAFFMN